MDDCLCFEAVNVSCSELTTGFVKAMNQISFILAFGIFALSFLIIILILKEVFFSIEEKTERLMKEAKEADKRKRVRELKKARKKKDGGGGMLKKVAGKLKSDAVVMP